MGLLNWLFEKPNPQPTYKYIILLSRLELSGKYTKAASTCTVMCETYGHYTALHKSFFEYYPYAPPVLSSQEFYSGTYEFTSDQYKVIVTKVSEIDIQTKNAMDSF